MTIRPLNISVTAAGGVIVVPTDWRGGDVTVVANYTAGTSYTAEYTTANIWDTTVTPIWTAITNMSTATADAAQQVLAPVTAVRLTHVGTNQTVFQIAQSPAGSA